MYRLQESCQIQNHGIIYKVYYRYGYDARMAGSSQGEGRVKGNGGTGGREARLDSIQLNERCTCRILSRVNNKRYAPQVTARYTRIETRRDNERK